MALPVINLNSRFEGEIEYARKRYGAAYALPGDLVQFRLHRGKKKSFKVMHIERASEYSADLKLATPFCVYYGQCGGCKGQHLDYDLQLDLKCQPVESALLEKFNIISQRVPAPNTKHYRHRMDFTVDGQIIGQRPVADYSKYIDIQDCQIQSALANQLLQIAHELIAQFPEIPYQRATNSGLLKYITLRCSDRSGLVILTLVKNDESSALLNDFLGHFKKHILAIEGDMGIVLTYSDESSEISAPPGGQSWHGHDYYIEKMGDMSFQVPYDSFFQPNPQAFDLLLNKIFATTDAILQNGPLGGLVDLYCGNAVLASIFSKRYPDSFNRIDGFEFTKSATQFAKSNLAHFQGPSDFFEADLNNPPESLIQTLTKPNRLIILDPPRNGISPKLIELLNQTRSAEYMLYISCNPQTQIRDLGMLAPHWQIIYACNIDCYPHTPHLEQAVLLKLSS